MRSIERVLLTAVVSLGLLIPSSGHAQRLVYVVPDFDPVATSASSGCGGVDFTIHRIPGVLNADVHPGQTHDVATRIILEYPAHGGFRTAIVGGTVHSFASGEHTQAAGARWTIPSDADFSDGRAGKITIVVDPDGRVLEGNEWNNVSSVACS
ncbi:MAG: hypothetical protein WEB06_08865 [Actinomycetota bacterium]